MSRASVTALFGVSSFEQAYYALRTRGSTLSPVFSAIRSGGSVPTATTFENLSSSGFNTVRDTNANTVTFNLNTCPNWTVGKTGKPLAQETAANRVSQQVALSAQFLAHVQFVVSQTTPMTGAEVLITPSGTYAGGSAFEGCVLMTDGRVFMVPSDSTSARIYDPVRDVVTTPTGAYPGGVAYQGGVLLSDGRVMCIPQATGSIRIYNPANDSLFLSTATWPGGGYNYGGTLMHDGRVFIPPYNNNVAIIYNPISDTITTAAGGHIWPSGAAYSSATLLLDGRVYVPPYTASSSRIYNPFTDTVSTPAGPNFALGTSSCLMADGRVYCAPYGASNPSFAIIYNPFNDSVITPNGTFSTSRAYQGTRLLPDGRIYLCPDSPTSAAIYDPSTNTTTTPNGAFPGATGQHESCVVLFSGDVFCAPTASTVARIHKIYKNTNFSPAALTGPYINKYG